MIAKTALLVAGTLIASVAAAGDSPPTGSKSLSDILKAVEDQKIGVVTEAEFDNGWWEVKVCKERECQKLYIDPKSGAEKRRAPEKADDETPPAGAKPLSQVIQSLEGRNLGVITEVELDDGVWEVEFADKLLKRKRKVDPGTGELRR
jgi:hypothetical protein